MKKYNGEKYIISFTTFPARFDIASKMVFNLLQNQTYKNFHIACTLYKEDYKQLSGNLKLFVDNDLIEIIIADENLCPHLKYYYALQKYKELPVITVDDDRIYSSILIEKLVSKYESLTYKSIVSTCAPVINKKILPVSNWCNGLCRLKPNHVSYFAMAEGFGGILYPPNCFNDLPNRINEIKKCLFHDDFYLKLLEIDYDLPITQINGTAFDVIGGNEMPGANETNLEHHNNAPMDYRIKMIEENKEKLNLMFTKHENTNM